MITSKERSNLKAIASNLEPIGQIGKGGLSENMLAGLSDALEKREIIKLTVLRNADCTPREALGELAEMLNAEPVYAIGSKIVLYRRSKRKDVEHIKF